MKEHFNEKQKNFADFIPLNQPMSPEEAINKLATFHNTKAENIIVAFMNLKNFNEGIVEFRDSVNNGSPCIIMEGRDKNNKHSWDHLIDKSSGQPQEHVA